MNICCTILLFAALSFPITSYAADILNFPDTLGSDPALTRAGVVQSWDPDNMFEHVNGEAELLKRFGAASLTFVSYENDNGDYFSIDVLDMREPINAYGLYRLYTGCDDTEYKLLEEKGPAHDKIFKVELILDGRTLAEGEGKSKKEAEQKAAKEAFFCLKGY